jgi:acetoin utilization deacetylase AcuC-like enzyme
MVDRLAVYFDPDVLEHKTGQGFFDKNASPYLTMIEKHPENADRVENMLAVLKNGPIAEALDWYQGESAERIDLERFHLVEYIDELSAVPVNESRRFSGTTVFGPRSFEICCKAAGLAIGAAEHVYDKKSSIAYALMRPPGHHAQPAMADGYCFFNNIGIAIEKLRSRGLKKAAVIDWDVHHGNGTQEGFYADPDILTVSMHMDHGAWGATHPQTGGIDETGSGPGRGKNLNLPMPFGSGDNKYLRVFDEIITPMVRDHRPEILFIAAGQDANQFDPNGRQLLSMHGFYELGIRARMLADECCEGKLVLIQEGGYSVSYAAYCLHATLEGVLNREPGLPDPIAFLQDNGAGIDDYISQVREIFDQSCSHS